MPGRIFGPRNQSNFILHSNLLKDDDTISKGAFQGYSFEGVTPFAGNGVISPIAWIYDSAVAFVDSHGKALVEKDPVFCDVKRKRGTK